MRPSQTDGHACWNPRFNGVIFSTRSVHLMTTTNLSRIAFARYKFRRMLSLYLHASHLTRRKYRGTMRRGRDRRRRRRTRRRPCSRRRCSSAPPTASSPCRRSSSTTSQSDTCHTAARCVKTHVYPETYQKSLVVPSVLIIVIV